MCVLGLGAAAGAAGAAGAGAGAAAAGTGAAAAGTGLASTAMGYLMDYGPMALSIGGSLLGSNSEQTEAEKKFEQLKWGIEARNIDTKGRALRNQDYYKQTAWQALDTATRAYLKTDIELDQAMSTANLATQTNLVNLIKGSGKGATKGLGGASGARIDMQAIKDWGRKDAAIRHGMNEKALAAEFNKESAQSRASKEIKIAGRKLQVDRSTIFEGIPEGPEPNNPIPGIAMEVGKGLFDLWSSKSGQSPFNFPGDSGFDASQAFSGNQNVLGGFGFDQNIDLGLGSSQFLSKMGSFSGPSPFSIMGSTPFSVLPGLVK